jgi:hypothetical protein
MAGRAGALLVIATAPIRATTPHAGLWRLALREAALAPGLEQGLAAARQAVVQGWGRQEWGRALAKATCPEAAVTEAVVTEAAVQCEAAV